jgi:hypothetical protein
MRTGNGSGLPHEGTGALREPVTGGIGGRATPDETAPAPSISLVTVTATGRSAASALSSAARSTPPAVTSKNARRSIITDDPDMTSRRR